MTCRKLLYDSFRAYDRSDTGVITLGEFEKVLGLLNIRLSEIRLGELFSKLDVNENGLVEYKEWIGLGGQIIFGIFV